MGLPSTHWYYGLIIISVILLAVSLIYVKDWRLMVLQLNIAAIIHPFEVVGLILLEAYRYAPGILPDQRLDNYLGSFVSNLLIVPAAAAAINAFSLSWASALGIAAIFAGVDWYFTTLGIYIHHWWKSIYTGIGIYVLFGLSKWVWAGLREKKPALIFKLLIIYLTYAPIHNFIVFAVNRGGMLFRFRVPGLVDIEKYHQALSYIHLFITAVIISLCIGLKIRLRYRLALVATLAAMNWSVGYYRVFVPCAANISPQLLLVVSAVAVPIVIILFKVAKLEYLFP